MNAEVLRMTGAFFSALVIAAALYLSQNSGPPPANPGTADVTEVE